jgi:hypothetical protein
MEQATNMARQMATSWGMSEALGPVTPAGEGRIDLMVPIVFSIDEKGDVGRETGSPVSPDYNSSDRNRFSGEVNTQLMIVAATRPASLSAGQALAARPF